MWAPIYLRYLIFYSFRNRSSNCIQPVSRLLIVILRMRFGVHWGGFLWELERFYWRVNRRRFRSTTLDEFWGLLAVTIRARSLIIERDDFKIQTDPKMTFPFQLYKRTSKIVWNIGSSQQPATWNSPLLRDFSSHRTLLGPKMNLCSVILKGYLTLHASKYMVWLRYMV